MSQSPLELVEKSRGESAFGRLLHFWRKSSGMSQEQLSGELGVSTRHISFLETGRSQPSRIVAAALADIFKLSGRDRAYLLTSAGFSADQSVFERPELLVWIRKAMAVALTEAEPAPAFVADSYGRILAVNRAWLAFFLPRVAPELLENDANMYEICISPKGLRPLLHNGDALACGMALYLTMETLQGNHQQGWDLLERLQAAGAVPKNWQQQGRRLVHTSDFPLSLIGSTGVFDVTVFNDTLSSTSQLVQPRLLVGRMYRDDKQPLLRPDELATVPDDHPLLYRTLESGHQLPDK